MRAAISAGNLFLLLYLRGSVPGVAPAEEPARQALHKWEYRIVPGDQLPDPRSRDLTSSLNKLGDEGWELIAVQPVYIFKRPNNQRQAEDIKRQINRLQAELDTWKNRITWTRLMAKKGFLSKNEVELEEALLRDVEIALERAQKELKAPAREPIVMPQENRKPQK
jgi:hypothetical protein